MPLGKAANPRRNPLEFDESDELVGAEGSDHALTSMGSCVPPVETASPGRNLQRRAEETRRGGSLIRLISCIGYIVKNIIFCWV